MDLDNPRVLMTASEKLKLSEDLNRDKPYGSPRKVWAEDGHVFLEGLDELLISMTPEVAIHMGRTLSEVGTDALINKVMDAVETKAS